MLAALFSLVCPLHAECLLETDESDDGKEVFVLENKYIRAVIAPSSSGRIAEFMLKKGERHFFPELLYKTQELTEGVFVVARTNYAGYEDWFREVGLVKQHVVYKTRIIEKTPDRCTLAVSHTKSVGELERIMTLRSGSAALEIETVITGKPQGKNAVKTVTYWPHIMIDPDRQGDHDAVRLFLPTRMPEKDHKKARMMQKVPFTCIVDRMAAADPVNMADQYLPAQPWRVAGVNGIILGAITPLDELEPDGIFYNFIDTNNPKLFSFETFFGCRMLSPGEKRSHHQILLARGWKHPVDFLDRNLIVACEWQGTDKLTMTVGGIATLSGVTAVVELLDNGKCVEKQKYSFGKLTPENEGSWKLSFRQKVKDPRIRVAFSDSSGKVITDAVILKRLSFPLKSRNP